MAVSQAQLGYGCKFEIAVDLNSPSLFSEIEEIYNITPPSNNLDQIDVTHMQSPNRTREFISGLNDPGEMSFEMNYIPGGVSDDILFILLNLPTGATRQRTCRLSYPTGVTDTFLAELTQYEPAIPHDDKMTATRTFKVSGTVSRGST